MNATPQQLSRAEKAVEEFVRSLGGRKAERKPVHPNVVEVSACSRGGGSHGGRGPRAHVCARPSPPAAVPSVDTASLGGGGRGQQGSVACPGSAPVRT